MHHKGFCDGSKSIIGGCGVRMLKIVIFILFPTLAFGKIPSFTSYQQILDKHLSEFNQSRGFASAFDYAAAIKDALTLKSIAEQKELLNKFNPADLETREEALAFWINTYNFFMIAKIVQDGSKNGELKIKGIKDLGSFFNSYSAFGEKDFSVNGIKMSLDEIEKGRLLSDEFRQKGWKDARIHFAVNCASVGCPPLRKSAYNPESINAVLDENEQKAMTTTRHIEWRGDTLWVTHLLKWYEKDFNENYGSVRKFIAHFTTDPAGKSKILEAQKMDYIPYDWKLNVKENFSN